jgi:23S rRNA (guanosine2251-2'-O)-methyltransferase
VPEALGRDPIPKDMRIVIGTHAIAETLTVRPKAVAMAWIKQGYESATDLRELFETLKGLKIKVEVKPLGTMDRFGGHQGAALMLKEVPELDWARLKDKKISKIMLLDGIEDPHNLGAVLRTSWLMGVDAVLIPQDRSVGLSPSVHKVACGGAEHVPVEICANFTNTLEELKKMGYWVFGLSHEGKKTLFDLKLPEKVVWAVGSEEKGLRTTTERLCDELVQIPQVSAAASYNASVAAAMALTETFRQQSL